MVRNIIGAPGFTRDPAAAAAANKRRLFLKIQFRAL
jgi:hypothetical protein